VNQSQASAGKKVSLLNFLFTIVLVIGGFLYLMVAAYSRDLSWFWPKFSSMPSQVLIRCYGSELNLQGNSPEVEAIARLVNGQISGDKRFDPLNLTAPTYAYYQSDPDVVTLELVYAEPIRIHLPNMYFTNITSLLIPLDGRYADSSIVFGLINDIPAGGSLHVTTNQPIRDYLADTGLCSEP
jgi:hypothetical protein